MKYQKRILIVDDDPVIVEMLSDLLMYAGYDIISAHHPGLAFMRTEDIDLVILDLSLSNDANLEVSKILCQVLEDNLRNTPTIIFSGYVEHGLDQKNLEKIKARLGYSRNIIQCVQKGERVKILLDAVAEYLKEQ